MIYLKFTTPWAVLICISGPATANPCLEDTTLTTMERSICLENRNTFLEEEMVSAYQLAVAQNAKFETPVAANLDSALQRAQIDFEKFRSSQCDFEASLQFGSSFTGLANIACRNALTEDRITFLKTYAGAS